MSPATITITRARKRQRGNGAAARLTPQSQGAVHRTREVAANRGPELGTLVQAGEIRLSAAQVLDRAIHQLERTVSIRQTAAALYHQSREIRTISETRRGPRRLWERAGTTLRLFSSDG
jgi:hypothetical protein